MGFSGIFKSLVGINGNLTLVEFGGIPGLVESGGFLRYVDISGNFRFRYGVCVVNYKALLLAVGGGKYKLKVILINGHLI